MISAVSTGMLQIAHFNLGNLPLGIVATLLNNMRCDIRILSSLLRFFNSGRGQKISNFLQTACAGMWDFFRLLWQILHILSLKLAITLYATFVRAKSC